MSARLSVLGFFAQPRKSIVDKKPRDPLGGNPHSRPFALRVSVTHCPRQTKGVLHPVCCPPSRKTSFFRPFEGAAEFEVYLFGGVGQTTPPWSPFSPRHGGWTW